MRSKLLKNKSYVFIFLSFFLPYIVLSIIFYLKGFYKTSSFLDGDMYEQYYPLFNYYKDLLDGTKTIFYNMNKGFGGTMFGTFFYYLSSPLNLLLFFFDKSHIVYFIMFLTKFKLSLCGLTMYIYMRSKYKNDNFIIFALSICYSLMGYNINYSLHIMWLDVIFLTPLVLLGLERLIEGKSSVLYMITLFIAIFSNYYLSYMLCLFCVIYFLYEIFLRYRINNDIQIIKQLTKKFIISSLLVGGLCSFFLIPCLFEMLNYGRGAALDSIFKFDYNFFDLFSKTYVGSLNLSDTLNYSSMNLFFCVGGGLLVFLYFYNKNMCKREKLLSLVVVLLFILPCFIGPLNYVWHLFTIPNYYSFRYSYLFCFFLINLSYKSIENLYLDKKVILLYLLIFSFISLYFIPITYYGNYYAFLNYKKIYITLFILLVYIFVIVKNYKKILPLIILIDLIINVSIIYYEYVPVFKQNELSEMYSVNEKILNYYNDQYRLGNELGMSMNDFFIFDYKSSSAFLSTLNYNSVAFYEKIINNYQGYNNSYIYSSINPLFDMLIGNKIIVTKNHNKNYNKLDVIEVESGKYYVYDNPYALKLGFMVNSNINNENRNEDIISWQNELFSQLFGKNYEFIKKYSFIEQDDGYLFKLNNKEEYLIVFFENKDIFSFEINGVSVSDKQIIHCSDSYCIIKNNYEDNLKIKIANQNGDIKGVSLGYFDYHGIKKLYNELSKNQFEVLEIGKNSIEGVINSSNDKNVLFLMLNYEKGFKIYVDDVLTDYYNLYGFIGINLDSGNHNIKIVYNQPYINVGCLLSAFTLFICFGMKKYNNKTKKSIY